MIKIANKYKLYDKIRLALSRSTQSCKRPCDHDNQRPDTSAGSSDSITSTKSHKRHKRPKLYHQTRPIVIDPYDRPTSTLLTPSKARTSIAPTPQRDGKVLGLFDGLSSGSVSRCSVSRKALLSVTGNTQITPSKGPSGQSGSEGQLKSSSVLTPTTQQVTKAVFTPSNRDRKHISQCQNDDTPAFLRRDSQRNLSNLENINDDDDDHPGNWSPMIKHRPAHARGLSALVKDLRAMQDDALDEDLDMLRDMENTSTFESFASKMHSQTERAGASVLTGDSQMPELPLGPDRRVDSEAESIGGEGKTRDGRVLKIWKKKGQKRTTRRVNMKPNQAKWKPEPKWNGGVVDESEDDGTEFVRDPLGEKALVEESRVLGPAVPEDGKAGAIAVDRDQHEDLPTNSTGDNEEEDDIVTKMEKYRKAKAAYNKDQREGLVQKAKKKISATAHANFRALKIKNKNSKAKGGGRFGRRR